MVFIVAKRTHPRFTEGKNKTIFSNSTHHHQSYIHYPAMLSKRPSKCLFSRNHNVPSLAPLPPLTSYNSRNSNNTNNQRPALSNLQFSLNLHQHID